MSSVSAFPTHAHLEISERERLVHFCARLTGCADVAEDLAHQALLESILHADNLRNPSQYHQWLTGIARNVCRRWFERSGKERRMISRDQVNEDVGWSLATAAALDDFDLEAEFERSELASLLDQALAFLPRETRWILTERYLHDLPISVIATHSGLSETAITVRLHRGKRALRHILATRLQDQLAPYGLVTADHREWQETSIWCPRCAKYRFQGRFSEDERALWLRCSACDPKGGTYNKGGSATLFQGVKGYKPAYTRLLIYIDGYFNKALATQSPLCENCGQSARVAQRGTSEAPRDLPLEPGVYVSCDCGSVSDVSLTGLVLALSTSRQFEREHRRICVLPSVEIEAQGLPAIVTSIQSATGSARLDVVSAKADFRLLGLYDTSDQPAPMQTSKHTRMR